MVPCDFIENIGSLPHMGRGENILLFCYFLANLSDIEEAIPWHIRIHTGGVLMQFNFWAAYLLRLTKSVTRDLGTLPSQRHQDELNFQLSNGC